MTPTTTRRDDDDEDRLRHGHGHGHYDYDVRQFESLMWDATSTTIDDRSRWANEPIDVPSLRGRNRRRLQSGPDDDRRVVEGGGATSDDDVYGGGGGAIPTPLESFARGATREAGMGAIVALDTHVDFPVVSKG